MLIYLLSLISLLWSIGLDGRPGLAGERGDIGLPGLQGDPGPSGGAGIKGIMGDPGDSGEPGVFNQQINVNKWLCVPFLFKRYPF